MLAAHRVALGVIAKASKSPPLREQIDALFWDDVHATDAGRRLLAELLLRFVRERPPQSPNLLGPAPPARRRTVIAVADCVDDPARRTQYARGGFACDVAVIEEGGSLTISLPPDCTADHVVALIHPRSGTLRLEAGTDKMVSHLFFDKWAYYARLQWAKLLFGAVSSVCITQLPGVPDITLLKGEISTESRVGQIAFLLVSE